MRSDFDRFREDEDAAATLEFVIIFLPLMFMIFLIVQVAIAYHWSLSAQKGLEVASRTAAVSVPVAEELTLTTALGTNAVTRTTVAGFEVGDDCFGGACDAVATYTCSGYDFPPHSLTTTCSYDRFMAIFDELDAFAYQVDPTDLTITYEDVGLGKAGRPYVPLITLSISEQSLPTIMRLLSVNLNEATEDPNGQETLQTGTVNVDMSEDAEIEFVIPALTSVIVAEDLGG